MRVLETLTLKYALYSEINAILSDINNTDLEILRDLVINTVSNIVRFILSDK